ncbi:MAG TPA: hypothetical protein VE620_11125 [Myxococcales bacterium]|jgi:ElaB/YqjD/DUF883 family membrane-anchored ribosome-binding protein|nr:hypothetical protein [Myxococcales bacterium]
MDGEVMDMGEVRGNQVQLPAAEIRAGIPARATDALGRGVAAGREWTRRATQLTLDWIEDHPGQALLIAVGAGFVLGQILFRVGPPEEEDPED